MDYDDAYANGAYIEGAADFPPRWAKAALEFRTALGARATLDVAYGDSARQCYDLFTPKGQPRGTVIFVHGGYWLDFDKSSWSHLAAGPLARGWAVMMPSYDLCPQVRISEITQQIAKAITHVAAKTEWPIALTGHSAGGHLVARMAEANLLEASVAARVKTIVPISPLADLRPLIHTAMNSDLRLDPEEAERESPMLQQKRIPADVTVWVGADERPAFLDQARWLANAWGAGQVIAPQRHHFDVIDDLADPSSLLCDHLLAEK